MLISKTYFIKTKNEQYRLQNFVMSNSSCKRPNISVNFVKFSTYGVGKNI